MDPRLEARLHTLADMQELHETLLRYCRAVDRGDRALLEATLTPDARIDTTGAAIGVDELAAALEAVEDGTTLSHFVGNDLIEIDGDRAAGEAYVLAMRVTEQLATGEQRMRIRGGRYLVRFARSEDGWRIEALTLVDDWSRVEPIVAADGVGAHRGSRSRRDPSYREHGSR